MPEFGDKMPRRSGDRGRDPMLALRGEILTEVRRQLDSADPIEISRVAKTLNRERRAGEAKYTDCRLRYAPTDPGAIRHIDLSAKNGRVHIKTTDERIVAVLGKQEVEDFEFVIGGEAKALYEKYEGQFLKSRDGYASRIRMTTDGVESGKEPEVIGLDTKHMPCIYWINEKDGTVILVVNRRREDFNLDGMLSPSSEVYIKNSLTRDFHFAEDASYMPNEDDPKTNPYIGLRGLHAKGYHIFLETMNNELAEVEPGKFENLSLAIVSKILNMGGGGGGFQGMRHFAAAREHFTELWIKQARSSGRSGLVRQIIFG